MKIPVPFLFACCAITSVGTLAAAPLKRADISVHPAWVLHVDCDALRETYLGKYLLYQLDKPEMKSNMVAFQSVFSFDLRTQVHGLTLFNDGPAPEDGIAILYADFEPAHLIKLVQATPEAETLTTNHHAIYSWLKDPSDPDGPRKYGAFLGDRLFSSLSRESMIDTFAVLDGTAPNLGSSKVWPELGAAGSNTLVQASARKMDFLGSDPNTALLKMARQAKFHASETEEQFKAALMAEFDDEATARQMSIVVQGMVALLGLQKDNPAAAKLADGISVKQDKATLTVTLAIPSTDLVAALKAYNAKKTKPQP